MSQELQVQAQSLMQKAEALKVVDQQSYAVAVEFQSGCAALIEKAEKDIRPSVQAAHTAWKSVLGLLQSITDPAGKAKEIAGKKAATWKAEQDRLAKLEAQRREEAARQAHLRELQEAEAERRRLQAQADAEAALAREAAAAKLASEIAYAARQGASVEEIAAIVETPIDVPPPVQVYVPPPLYVPPPPPPKPVSVSGESTRTTWKAEVQDLGKLVAAVAAGTVPLAVLEVNTTMLNKLVAVSKAQTSIPGVRVYEDVTFVKGRK